MTDQIKRRKRLRKRGGREVAGIGFLHDDDARILAEFPGKLAVPDIHGINLGRAVLQEAIGESAGGSAQVQRGLPA